MNSKIGIIIQREYLERVSKKSFIITTILMPLFIVAMMILPSLIMIFGGKSDTDILVIDESGKVFPKLHSTESIKFIATDEPLDSALTRDASGVLLIPANVMSGRTATLKYFSNGPSSFENEMDITSQVKDIIRDYRLSEYNIADIDKILEESAGNVSVTTIRTDKEDDEQSLSSAISYILGIAMSFILYMFILIYGQMIMTSIIEEKNNRVLELVVSSIRPAQLMMGKILGVSLVALTQIVIWGIIIISMVTFVMPAMLNAFLPEQALADITAVQNGTLDQVSEPEAIDLIQGVLFLGNVGFIVKMILLMTVFLIGGFLFYAAIFAAIGSSVDNIQDASQLTSIATFPVIFSIIFAMMAAGDPTSGLAFWTSLIPFTSPMVMVARIPHSIPGWEVILSLIVLVISFVFMVWFAGKIYRVGIFMYGKKPTIKEIIRWTRYK